jgi:Cof subfamily protein (haloacid dehalogenase superfamily)
MNKTKAIILDLDGTLFNSGKEISRKNLNAILQCMDRGYFIIIATARPLRTVMNKLPAELAGCYLVLCNGAWIVRNGDILYRHEMKGETALDIVKKLKQHGYNPSVEANNCIYFDDEKYPGFEGYHFPLHHYASDNACKVLASKSTGIDRDVIHSIVPQDLSYVITDNNTLVQILRRNCSKASACKKILDLENIPVSHTYAFGDDHNDIPVFELVNYGIAMGNAVKQLKEQAQYITVSNDDDGVAYGIVTWVLG